jgi:PGF-pre-PGF domain-containing protein
MKTAGKTTTIVEMLKEKSTLVSEQPSDEVYKFFNVWVGTGGFGDSNNIANAVVDFRVEKSWLKDKNIDKSLITLNRYSDNKWNQLPTTISREDDTYIYYTAKTPGFSPFTITGKTAAKEAVTETQTRPNIGSLEQNNSTVANSGKENTKTPGFESICGIFSLLAIFRYRKK